MNFYLSDDSAELRGMDPNKQYRPKWADADAVNPRYGAAKCCPKCGRYISPLTWENPKQIRLSNSRFPDRISFWLNHPLVVSERFMSAYLNSELTGICSFIPIETVGVSRKRGLTDLPKYYCAETEYTEHIKVNFEQSIIEGQPYDWKCSLCNPRGATKDRVEKYVFETDGAYDDVSQVYGAGLVYSQRFFDFISDRGFTNFNLVEAASYRFGK